MSNNRCLVFEAEGLTQLMVYVNADYKIGVYSILPAVRMLIARDFLRLGKGESVLKETAFIGQCYPHWPVHNIYTCNIDAQMYLPYPFLAP